MKFRLRLILLLFLGNSGCVGWAQSSACSCKADTVQQFSLNRKVYDFKFTQQGQGLCFNNVLYEKLPEINVHIINNTLDTIVNLYKERDAHIHWLRAVERSDTLLPGQTMMLKGLASGGSLIGYMNTSSIYLKYRIKDSLYTNKIQVCGTIYPKKYLAENAIDTLLYKTKGIVVKTPIQYERNSDADSSFTRLAVKIPLQQPMAEDVKLLYRLNTVDRSTHVATSVASHEFVISCHDGDTVYYSVFSSNYGVIKKGSFIKAKHSDSIQLDLTNNFTNDENYWFWMNQPNNKGAFGLSSNGIYHVWKSDVACLFPDYTSLFRRLDSLNIRYRNDDHDKCYVLNLGGKDPQSVSKALKNIAFHQTIHPTNHFYDKCYLFLSPQWVKSDADVKRFIDANNLAHLVEISYPAQKVWRGDYDWYKFAPEHYFIVIKLPYSYNHENRSYLNRLLSQFEVSYIDSGVMLDISND